MNKKQIVAVIGDGALPPNSEKERFAEGLGEALVTAGYRIICGGLGGVMEAAARGAHRSPWYRDGDVIGVLPGCSPDAANEFIDIPIATGLDHARNFIVVPHPAVTSNTFADWSAVVADKRLDDKERCPDIPDDRIFGVDTPEEAVILLAKKLPQYQGRPPCAGKR